jgi:predicted 2-oxoglutarate/Fe(II)-dependent dioxygenase YbiX
MYIPPSSIEPTEIVGGCISIYRDIWDNPQETIDLIENITSNPNSGIEFKKAPTTTSTMSKEYNSVRTNSHLSLTEHANTNDDFRKLNNRYLDLIFSATSYYSKMFMNNGKFYINEGFNILKYQTGQEYKSHFDGLTASHRAISPILYLNNNYTGGEIEFVFHNVTIKPSPGMLIVFPSNYAYSHIAHPVKTGTKYAIVTWIHDHPSFGQ